jgi:hypothetical protein
MRPVLPTPMAVDAQLPPFDLLRRWEAIDSQKLRVMLIRVGHTRYLTDQGAIQGLKVDRELNLADVGTHYCSREVLAYFEPQLRGAGA